MVPESPHDESQDRETLSTDSPGDQPQDHEDPDISHLSGRQSMTMQLRLPAHLRPHQRYRTNSAVALFAGREDFPRGQIMERPLDAQCHGHRQGSGARVTQHGGARCRIVLGQF